MVQQASVALNPLIAALPEELQERIESKLGVKSLLSYPQTCQHCRRRHRPRLVATLLSRECNRIQADFAKLMGPRKLQRVGVYTQQHAPPFKPSTGFKTTGFMAKIGNGSRLGKIPINDVGRSLNYMSMGLQSLDDACSELLLAMEHHQNPELGSDVARHVAQDLCLQQWEQEDHVMRAFWSGDDRLTTSEFKELMRRSAAMVEDLPSSQLLELRNTNVHNQVHSMQCRIRLELEEQEAHLHLLMALLPKFNPDILVARWFAKHLLLQGGFNEVLIGAGYKDPRFERRRFWQMFDEQVTMNMLEDHANWPLAPGLHQQMIIVQMRRNSYAEFKCASRTVMDDASNKYQLEQSACMEFVEEHCQVSQFTFQVVMEADLWCEFST
jgi:hypothetical protein